MWCGTLKRLGSRHRPSPTTKGCRATGVQLEEYDSDLLGTERPTRMPPDSQESPARGTHPRALPPVGTRGQSPAARKNRKCARWPYLPRPDFRPERTGSASGGLPGGGVTPDARAPGSVLGSDPPKPAWSHALSGSCKHGHFLSWTRMIPSTATMQPIVPAVGCGNERPAGSPTRLASAPRTPPRTGLAPGRRAPST